MSVKTIVIVAALLTGLLFAAVALIADQPTPPEIVLYASNMPGVLTVDPDGRCLRGWLFYAHDDGRVACAPDGWRKKLNEWETQ